MEKAGKKERWERAKEAAKKYEALVKEVVAARKSHKKQE